jgi:hypothetical protein
MEVVVEVLAATAMLSEACHTRMAHTIMADATEVLPALVGEKDIGAEVDRLRKSLEPPASACQSSQIHGAIYCDKYIGIFWDRLGRRQRAYKGDAQHPPTIAGSPHEGADSEKQRPARLWY